jgi:uncharacterized protein YecE (DUF72 family)
MILIGLTGWGDHDTLYPDPAARKNKLKTYSEWFRAVEVDSSFYAVQPKRNMEKWTADTPDDLRFLVKAYQGMTGHARGPVPFENTAVMFEAFRLSLESMIREGKLAAALFQYPPWFDCTRENVAVLREAKAMMDGLPCALEFRHQSWFRDGMKERTLDFMRQEGWIHSICDEPQAGEGSVPIVEEVTSDKLTVVRLHGRNAQGWNSGGQPNWREVRYLYRYSEEELAEWAQRLRRLEARAGSLLVVFNNNSGGDAADNAKSLMAMIGQVPPRGTFETGEAVEQLDLFGGLGEQQ